MGEKDIFLFVLLKDKTKSNLVGENENSFNRI
ncbi:hypothetical protein LCGC14_1449030 [marine sediment metagenome]|uniref:Uncharacterized protein n=1 Tax=marine sediment metagenome TaxID=412755 RepID=A0A0F9MKB9_9ZZZZ